MNHVSYPDYVPRWWTRGGLNRWFARSPKRVIAWLSFAPLLAAAIAVTNFLNDEPAFGVIVAILTLGLIAQSAVYIPRAWRAARGR
jgi:hypothetical protein